MFSEFRNIVEDGLGRFLERSDACPARLEESMRYSVEAGGKRLRPVMVLMACEACGGDPQNALPAAVAIEYVHTYSLIHDDLPAMDNDDLRRGRPTNHKQFDEATAILAGDGLLTLAFEIIAREIAPADVALACVIDLASAAGIEGMVGGQMADLQGERAELVDSQETAASDKSGCAPVGTAGRTEQERKVAQLEAIHLRKTGRLLRSALTMGARIARADKKAIEMLDHYGRCVGLAFQIADDLLDITGDAAKMGKGVRKDAELGKLTYPGLLGLEESRRRAQSLIDEACRSIEPLGDRGLRLEALARFVLERDH
ncbi:MAG: polyprenyl synthetase family protein [Planctomycetota bacterium]|nr:polyprenyl synthetase family protein [Planctomycetota bacterium]MDA1164527.1 polyprenyl synthetase family protein [Planctomycetota bacterium]